MKLFYKSAMFFVLLATCNLCGSIVNISNKTLFKIKASLDIVMYPDPQKEIGANSTISENIGVFFMRGLIIGVHIGDQFLENMLVESISQTLGFGDIDYNIFTEIKNLGRGKFIDEMVLEITFSLVRSPKFLYPGGVVSTSEPITVVTRNMKTFEIVDKDYINLCASICNPVVQGVTQYVPVQQVQQIQQISAESPKVAYGGTVVR